MARVLILATLLLAAPATAQQGKVLQQQVLLGEGHTVLRVWGTAYDMGYAQGFLLAPEIVAVLVQTKALVTTSQWATGRLLMPATIWKPAEVEQEIAGLVAGVKARVPLAAIDAIDVKLLNTYGDWSYACRSHSAWGALVKGPAKTLSTRRLDFGTPFSSAKHHVLLARQPSDGSLRWVSLGWPGFVLAATAVNEHGTLASLHDYQSQAVAGAFMPRSALVRWSLTLVKDLPLDQHLDAVWAEVSKTPIVTSTFLNYYVPEGHGGVITCLAGKVCSKKRVPQADYFGGEVLITANAETDGHSAPSGAEFIDAYYAAGGAKTLADHYGLMGHTGLHLMSVEYRARGDITIWAEGRTSIGVTPTIKVEFAQLFDPAAPTVDAAPPRDSSAPVADRAPLADREPTPAVDGAGSPPPKKSAGCDCSATPALPSSLLLALLAGAALAIARGRRR